MIARAKLKYLGVSAQKTRLVIDQVRGRTVEDALTILRHSPKLVSRDLEKLLKSAVANASQNEDVNVNRLYVCDSRADDGPLLNGRLRWRPGPQGRAMPFRKRMSHLTVTVREREEN